MWPGFRASAFSYNMGMALVLDNVNKFMSTKTCLDRMYELIKTNPKSEQVSAMNKEFVGASVIANWGNKKAYTVNAICWDKNPMT